MKIVKKYVSIYVYNDKVSKLKNSKVGMYQIFGLAEYAVRIASECVRFGLVEYLFSRPNNQPNILANKFLFFLKELIEEYFTWPVQVVIIVATPP
jgi:hypothetical protein